MNIIEQEKSDLLKSITDRYGYDFLDYSEASIKRRIIRFAELNKFNNYFDLKHHLLNNESLFAQFVLEVTVNVTEMFRDPSFFISLVENVFPILQTFPHRKIWHAGCSTGEEVYSLAIFLHEQNLFENTRQYATDVNTTVIKKAKDGIYSLERIREYTRNYQKAGGMADFSDYYTAHYDSAIMNYELKKYMVFSNHNLVSDKSFNEFNLIVCRNVLIYFNWQLQEKVIQLFDESLSLFGYLALGSKESIMLNSIKHKYEVIDERNKIYRKIA